MTSRSTCWKRGGTSRRRASNIGLIGRGHRGRWAMWDFVCCGQLGAPSGPKGGPRWYDRFVSGPPCRRGPEKDGMSRPVFSDTAGRLSRQLGAWNRIRTAGHYVETFIRTGLPAAGPRPAKLNSLSACRGRGGFAWHRVNDATRSAVTGAGSGPWGNDGLSPMVKIREDHILGADCRKASGAANSG